MRFLPYLLFQISIERFQSRVLDWDADPSTWPAAHSFDVILASDILYDERHVPAVIRLITHLMRYRKEWKILRI